MSSSSPLYSVSWQCHVLYQHNTSCFTIKDPWGHFISTTDNQDTLLHKIVHLIILIIDSFTNWIENQHAQKVQFNYKHKNRNKHEDKKNYSIENFTMNYLLDNLESNFNELDSSMKRLESLMKMKWSSGYIQTISFPASLLSPNYTRFLFSVTTKYDGHESSDQQLILVPDKHVEKWVMLIILNNNK